MSDTTIKNMEEFAVVSGISRPTLSKYFNDPESVRQSTKAKIEAALELHAYRPNMYAMNQNRRSTRNIGIIVPFLADPFFAEIARNIENLVINEGYRPILLSSHGDPRQEVENLISLRDIKPAGVLLAPLGRSSNIAEVGELCSEFPTVLFDCNIESLNHAFVGHNNTQATDIMVDYLVRTGEPPVYFEIKNPPNPNTNKRRLSYIHSMERQGLEPRIFSVDGESWNFEEIGYNQGKKLISSKDITNGTVLFTNDRLAIGFLAAAYEMGLRVGRGTGCALRVAGHDNHPYSRFTCPALTTVSHDYDAISRTSVTRLFDLLENREGGNSTDEQLFPGKLIMRDSA
jgi:DNA-binding LacI/PurR family transcriptional regulator